MRESSDGVKILCQILTERQDVEKIGDTGDKTRSARNQDSTDSRKSASAKLQPRPPFFAAPRRHESFAAEWSLSRVFLRGRIANAGRAREDERC
jgi:hypothetical protein